MTLIFIVGFLNLSFYAAFMNQLNWLFYILFSVIEVIPAIGSKLIASIVCL